MVFVRGGVGEEGVDGSLEGGIGESTVVLLMVFDSNSTDPLRPPFLGGNSVFDAETGVEGEDRAGRVRLRSEAGVRVEGVLERSDSEGSTGLGNRAEGVTLCDREGSTRSRLGCLLDEGELEGLVAAGVGARM